MRLRTRLSNSIGAILAVIAVLLILAWLASVLMR
jgi:hypothetical protein